MWKSKTFRAKVHEELPIPLILGMPFLSSEHVVIDPHERTAIVDSSGFDIMNPKVPVRTWAPDRVTPPPTPPKQRLAPLPSLEDTPAAGLKGCELPRAIIAAVHQQLESLNLAEELRRRDAEMKVKFADRFPICLPDTSLDDVPDHIFHRIRLKDPSKVVRGRGYSAPKHWLEPWKLLLDEHLAAGRMQPSSSEHASPAFCIPKSKDGVPDLSVPPRWVNDYRELNQNTIRDNYPLPRVDDILGDCGKGKIFGKLDMTNSFFQTRVHPDDYHLTAVHTPWGLYEWKVMPMGGCNAPSTHQRRMTDAL